VLSVLEWRLGKVEELSIDKFGLSSYLLIDAWHTKQTILALPA
jgi:hypothetical protein